jgi:hypothetical protein
MDATTTPQGALTMTTATTTRPQDLLLNYVTGLAKDFYPELADQQRIDKAVAIIASGKMALLDDGAALVQSQTHDDQVYNVNGSCQCQDYRRAHGGR